MQMPSIGIGVVYKASLLLATVYLYYFAGKRPLLKLAGHIAHTYIGHGGASRAEVRGQAELLLLAVSHVVICAALLLGTPVHISQTGLLRFDYLHVVLGIPLGLAEMGIASLSCRTIVDALVSVKGIDTPPSIGSWLSMSRAGWIRHHLRSLNSAPFAAATSLICLQISSEEIIFRSVFLGWKTNPAYPSVWVVLTVTAFCAVQVSQMPSWQTALFPVTGAAVMGIVHSFLFMSCGEVWPLIVAHLVFFVVAVS
jgi:Type II CAAX prenyl endopeptidase Rce1-like